MLNIRHSRDGKPLTYEWQYRHLLAVHEVTEAQGLNEKLRHEGKVEILQDAEWTGDDGKFVMSFKAGDLVEMWRI